jgi:hypothetical protein
MLEVVEQLEALGHDRARGLALQVDDETDAAGVFLVLRVVEALGLRRRGRRRRPHVRGRRLEKVALPDARAGRTVRGVFVHVDTPKGNAAAEGHESPPRGPSLSVGTPSEGK